MLLYLFQVAYFTKFFLVSSKYFIKVGFTITKKAEIAQEALQYLVKKGKIVVLDVEVGMGLGTEANIAVTTVRFNPVIKLNIYTELIEKACILLRI